MSTFKSQVRMLSKSVIREEPNYWNAGENEDADGTTGDTEYGGDG